jgi:diamine N-acetyltransferase
MKLARLTPMLGVANLPASVAFYERLGFTVEHQRSDWGWASMRCGEWRLMLDQSVHRHPGVPRTAVIYLYPEDVRGFHAELRARGVDVPDLDTTFYGHLEFRLEDPDGHPLWVGQPPQEPAAGAAAGAAAAPVAAPAPASAREAPPPNVSLREITEDTVRAVTKLAVHPSQAGFVASNAVSLAQALFSEDAWYRAIHDGDEPVGFVMLADETQRATPPEKPNIGLWRLMIDARHQHRGIGREAMRLVLEHVQSRPGVHWFYTSWVPEPGGPGPFYLGLGFTPTGEIDEGEVVAIHPASPAALRGESPTPET